MSGEAITRVSGASISCEEKSVLAYLADQAGGKDGYGIDPDINERRVAERTGLSFIRLKEILAEFFQNGVLYPRQRDWSFDVVQASRIYPAPEINDTYISPLPRRSPNG